MTIPPPPSLPPEPPVRELSVSELRGLVEEKNVYRAKAVFELATRAAGDLGAVEALAALSELPVLREDRLHGYVSLAWMAVVGLLAAETAESRRAAYDAFAKLAPGDQELFLTYVRAGSIEEAHPRL